MLQAEMGKLVFSQVILGFSQVVRWTKSKLNCRSDELYAGISSEYAVGLSTSDQIYQQNRTARAKACKVDFSELVCSYH